VALMAVQGPFKVSFGEVFPHGAFVKGGVERVRDFDRSSRDNFVQMIDKATGLPLWQVEVIDGDPESKGSLKVKIACEVQPVAPEPMPGFPFAPVILEGLTVTPYLTDAKRIAYSLRASAISGLKPAGRSGSAAGVKDAA
jgi:hypothetical protein